jgi:hypothetical protein
VDNSIDLIKKTTHNIGIAASGAGRWNFGCLHGCTLVRADEFQIGFLLLTSTLYFQLGSSSGLDVINIPPAAIPVRCTPFFWTPYSVTSFLTIFV